MILARLRESLPADSLFRIPLVFHLTWVLVLKLTLLVLLWQLAFKPLLVEPQAPVEVRLGVALATTSVSTSSFPSTPALKDVTHD